jgi:hypothetical protein
MDITLTVPFVSWSWWLILPTREETTNVLECAAEIVVQQPNHRLQTRVLEQENEEQAEQEMAGSASPGSY